MTSQRVSNGGQVGAVLVARKSLARFSCLRHMKLIDIFSLFISFIFLLSHAHEMRNERSEDHLWYIAYVYLIYHTCQNECPIRKVFANVALYFFLLKFDFFKTKKKSKINGGKTLEIWTCAWKRSQDKLAALSVKQRRRWRRLRRMWETLVGPVLG